MSRLPSFTELVDWVEGRLDEVRAARVATLVADGVSEVVDSVAWIREFRRAADVLPLQRPAAEVSASLRQLFRDHHAVGNPGWVEAVLRFDSRTQPMVGVRSAATAELAHLVYDGDFGAVVVNVNRLGQGQVGLRGYVSLTAADEDGTRVSLRRSGTSERITRCDENGRFELSDVLTDVDELWIAQGDTRVRMPLDLHAG